MSQIPDEKHLSRVSRTLSSTLRHNALSEGLKPQKDGYVNVAELLAMQKYKKLGLDFQILQHIVETNGKSRYKMIRKPEGTATTGTAVEAADSSTSTLLPPDIGKDEDPGDFLIRANQGHSIAVESALLLKPITADGDLPPVCIHATFYGALEAIISSGHLSRMSRTHIHCAPGLPKPSTHSVTGEAIPAVKSGMRFDAEVLIYIDLPKALADGVPFWISENGVILTEGLEGGKLPLEYVEKIDDYKGQAGGGSIWTREEGTVKEWPKGGKGKKKFNNNNRGKDRR